MVNDARIKGAGGLCACSVDEALYETQVSKEFGASEGVGRTNLIILLHCKLKPCFSLLQFIKS